MKARIDFPNPPVFCSSVTPGDAADISSMRVAPRASNASAENAVIDTGVRCTSSDRKRAVTTISSRELLEPAAALSGVEGGSAARTPEATLAIAKHSKQRTNVSGFGVRRLAPLREMWIIIQSSPV